MLDALDAARRAFGFAHEHHTNAITGLGHTLTRNNGASVQARIAAIRSAMEAAEQLALGEPDQSLVAGKLVGLRNSLPAVSTELLPATGRL